MEGLGIDIDGILDPSAAKGPAKRPRPNPKPKAGQPAALDMAAPHAATPGPSSSAGAAGTSTSPAGGSAKAGAGAGKSKAGSKARAPAAAARRKATVPRGAAADSLLITPPAVPEPVVSEGRGQFSRELASMMYGFGDAVQPDQESVELVEDIAVAYLMEVSRKASQHAAQRGDPKVAPEDVMFVVRKDPRKLARIRELLLLEKEVKAAKNPLRNLDGVPDDLEVGEVEDAEEGGGDE